MIRARVRESATRSVGDAWLASAGATSCDGGVRASSTPETEADGTLTLVFPRGPAEQLLQAGPSEVALLLVAKAPSQNGACLTAPVTTSDSRVLYRPSRWGVGLSVRYRPPALRRAEFGHSASLEAGLSHWQESTRWTLAAEGGYATCRGGSDARRDACGDDNTLLPVGVSFSAHHFFQSAAHWVFAPGVGYQGVAVLGRSALNAQPFLHGPRLELVAARTPTRLRNVPDVLSTYQGASLGVDLLWGPEGAALVPFVGWCTALTF